MIAILIPIEQRGQHHVLDCGRDQLTSAIRVIDLSAMKAKVEIDELDVHRVRPGQKVRFFFDALPDFEIIGYVFSLPQEG